MSERVHRIVGGIQDIFNHQLFLKMTLALMLIYCIAILIYVYSFLDAN